MPYLGDYLGHLLSEITLARLHADLEAVRIAELYAEHPLLRGMPVPRFRLPEIEVNVPVVINEMEPEAGTGTAPAVTDLRKAFDGVFATQLKEQRIELSAAARTKINRALDRTTLELTKPPEVGLEMNRVAVELTNTALKALSETIEPKKLAELEKELAPTVRVEFLKFRKVPPRLDTLITSAQVKEAGPGEVVTRLRLKVIEESFEWTTIESEDGKQDRLVIE